MNSLLDAGFTIRTQPRFYIGNRSGREFEKPIAITPGRGTLDLVYNPALQLHRALRRPYALEAKYVIRSIMAPPYMNMVAGRYYHTSSAAAGLSPEDASTMTIEMLDNDDAEYIPARLYQLSAQTRGNDAESRTGAQPTGFRQLTPSAFWLMPMCNCSLSGTTPPRISATPPSGNVTADEHHFGSQSLLRTQIDSRNSSDNELPEGASAG